MYEFKYHRPATVRQAANLLVKNEDAKLIAGGHTLVPVMKQRLASPPHLVDLSHIEGLDGIEMKGRSLVIGATAKHADVANSADRRRGDPGAGRTRRADRRSRGAPQRHHRRLARQQRSDRRLSGRLPGARRHHRHQQAPAEAGRILPGAVHDRARERRDHHQGDVPAAEEGRLRQIPQPGLALCAGRRVRRQAAVGCARCRHRRRLRRRVPRHRVRGSAEEALLAQGARRPDGAGGRAEQRPARQRRISRASDRRCWRAAPSKPRPPKRDIAESSRLIKTGFAHECIGAAHFRRCDARAPDLARLSRGAVAGDGDVSVAAHGPAAVSGRRGRRRQDRDRQGAVGGARAQADPAAML